VLLAGLVWAALLTALVGVASRTLWPVLLGQGVLLAVVAALQRQQDAQRRRQYGLW